MLGLLRDLYRYRSFVLASAWREIQGQYQGALLGISWSLIAPIAMLTIYTVIFANVMGTRLPGVNSTFSYSIFLCAGLLPWTYFSDGISKLTGVFVSYGGLIKKAQFPRICLPFIALGVASFNFSVIVVIFMLFLLATGNFPGWISLLALPVLAVQTLLMLGFGVLLGTLNVFFRDVGQLVGIGFQFLFWLTPIVYPMNAVPPWVQSVIAWNPMATLVQLYQSIFVFARLPEALLWQQLGWITVLAAMGIVLGMRVHRARAGEMADEF